MDGLAVVIISGVVGFVISWTDFVGVTAVLTVPWGAVIACSDDFVIFYDNCSVLAF